MRFQKKSTDGILFSPSIGFITRDFETMRSAICRELKISLTVSQEEPVRVSEAMDIYAAVEGHVDVWGLGDTVFGHMGEETAACQKQAKKA